MSVETLNDSQFMDVIANSERVAIKYFADWCGSCRLIAPKFKKMSEDPGNSSIRFVEINAEKNPDARKWAKVTNLPFFAMVKNGEIVESDSVGKEEKVLEMLKSIA